MRSLESLFSAFDQLTVLIVGDVMVDSYLWGKSTRLSPEAPVPIVNVLSSEKRLGGAANVALNVQALGATTLLCSVIGTDKDGSDFIALLEENNLSTEGIIQSPDRVTTVKQRILSGGQQLLRLDSEIETDLLTHENQHLLARFEELLVRADVVIFQDYDKGVLSEQNIAQLIALAQHKNIPTVVDPKKKNFLRYKGCALFKPNLKELKEGLKVEFADANLAAFEQAVANLQNLLETENILVTLSERGVFCAAGKNKTYIDAHLRTISDVSGAGDTVISIAAVCMALNLPLPLLAELSNLGGGLVCEEIGVVPIDKVKLYQEAKENKILANYPALTV
ncbi:bifunctional heptose 7-phosphate kinase/heptose 1-phosphate adenyltransferase [Adhaeribacter rhizoryzae]|uniref:bifunctional heptose 7-phosphate kinase/heptose 1-phosphate adenyltransferase n=1 Tax=Adhaeribacter rhizoryzae TaxID=2607907 RepID=UPI002938FDDA|nr:bifunctional ADP-heptose synthase [Adhaeribacter rhizoryzae]